MLFLFLTEKELHEQQILPAPVSGFRSSLETLVSNKDQVLDSAACKPQQFLTPTQALPSENSTDS